MKVTDLGSDFDDKLPPIPTISPDDQKAIDEQQAKMAAHHPINASNRDYDNAHALIVQLEQQPLKSLGRHLREQYAEALAITGQYDKAAKITKDDDKKREYKAVWKAIWLDDDKDCKCIDTDTVDMIDGRPQKVTYSRKFQVNRIFSHKHNNFVRLERCNRCGFNQTKNA